jgi:hypothetical protein
VLAIYDNLAYYPQNWYDSGATFQAATGRSVSQLVSEFASEFWLQTYEPIKAYTFWSRLPGSFSGYNGVTVNLNMGADSSRGASAAPIPAFRPSLLDETMVARAPGLPFGATVNVYRDTAPSSATPAAPVLIGTLSSLTPVIDLGTFDDSIGCYRLVAVTPAGAEMSTAVTVEPVHLVSGSPGGGSKAGGYAVTLDGYGFGDQPGIVMMGPAIVQGSAITSWTDTRIVFIMPNMGETTDQHVVQVQPVIGGISNGWTFTVF